ncbi:glycosyltransferase family 4 protein [Peribacillus psychrosaccharolyticus]|uniref:Glycosyltransferase family 4 protein n=1 Tax=Peribacillus psychrosaccharolyticus TaxID=1407 RepID=A0A974NN81_PERPY|nr:glycosyltransferase family 4 protein [Peribacillus psychrosaccharolyticus]MEC2056068.1 glycosyltransferase family 4 protein [Peribacillus psychrosaccharolyticus]MED3745509.1 glycosyltransferase family 4 protein [Peribacillus psychrosaccharolyticus]QQT00735.1 glycosyltransferase family 4 protein [Peribacillus psychrosaccharolyticus]
MEKKVLFVATKDIHFDAFHLPTFKWFEENGYKIHTAAVGDLDLPFVDQRHDIPIQRSPFSLKNIIAYQELKKIMDQHSYQIIHCHTPMGGVLSRLAARTTRMKGTKVIYTAHGFHFCKGSPFINWMMYYPIEKSLARMTDCLITINNEDYQLAKERKFKAVTIKHVHGVGVDNERFHPISAFSKSVLRSEHGYKNKEFILFYAAEFNKNKNQQLLIRALSSVKEKIPQAKLLLAGTGPLLEECKKSAVRLGVEHMVDFLGFRKDIDSLLKISDLAVASSLREGLPVNIMEAMSSGLPVIATKNRGHMELIQQEKNGYLIPSEDDKQFSIRILELFHSIEQREKMGKMSEKIINATYTLAVVRSELNQIYTGYMVEDTNEESGNKYYRTYI